MEGPSESLTESSGFGGGLGGPYLRERWASGCDNALQLWREQREQGYAGLASHVRQFVARRREQPSRPGKKGPRHVSARVSVPPPTVSAYSARQTTWHLVRDPAVLTEHERAYVAQLKHACPLVARLQGLVLAFRDLVHKHDLAAFAGWLEDGAQANVPELTGFVNGLRPDRAAQRSMLSWSQGQTEGQVNGLKTLKRAMYGRANFDLPKLR